MSLLLQESTNDNGINYFEDRRTDDCHYVQVHYATNKWNPYLYRLVSS